MASVLKIANWKFYILFTTQVKHNIQRPPKFLAPPIKIFFECLTMKMIKNNPISEKKKIIWWKKEINIFHKKPCATIIGTPIKMTNNTFFNHIQLLKVNQSACGLSASIPWLYVSVWYKNLTETEVKGLIYISAWERQQNTHFKCIQENVLTLEKQGNAIKIVWKCSIWTISKKLQSTERLQTCLDNNPCLSCPHKMHGRRGFDQP